MRVLLFAVRDKVDALRNSVRERRERLLEWRRVALSPAGPVAEDTLAGSSEEQGSVQKAARSAKCVSVPVCLFCLVVVVVVVV